MLPGFIFIFNCSKVRLLSTLSAQKKIDPCKGKSVFSDIRMHYPTSKISNSNLNFKLLWRKILPLAPRNYFRLAPNRIFLEIGDFRIFFWGILLCFPLFGFTVILLSWGTTWIVKWWNGETNLFLLVFNCASPFVGDYIPDTQLHPSLKWRNC